jgi:undecaprenyl pyrophosphate phosphatase UppP
VKSIVEVTQVNLIQAFFLGKIQGLAEFIPASSIV